jgi:hypothetical protein
MFPAVKAPPGPVMETAAKAQRRSAPDLSLQAPVEAAGARAVACRQLAVELESAVAFADYCRYLGGEALTSRVEHLVQLAEALYRDTLATQRDDAAAEHR